MISRTRMFSVTTGIALLLSATAFAKESAPSGSFLRYRANTVAALQSQVANDRVVQARYVAHFKVSSAEVKTIIKNGVKLVSLDRPVKVEMWYISKSGHITHKTKLLPKGSQVFATKSGQPLLAWSCGNPLRAALPKAYVSAQGDSLNKTVTEKVLGTPVEVISTAAVAVPPGLVTETAPMLAAAAPLTAMPSLATAAAPAIGSIIPAAVSSGGALYNLGWLAGLGALVSAKTTYHTVPEPSSLLALGLSIGPLMLLGTRKMLSYRK
ncbi:MAG: PEP-CTERM sorting domain-containing protein [Armatimonadetes bacterium]|nr:PEP-CTERM sorting domain-containing protein [Armatimonadota bacterium]